MKSAIIVTLFMLLIFYPRSGLSQYCNNGLKYASKVVLINLTASTVQGKFSTVEYNTEDTIIVDFNGARKGNNLYIKFNGTSPVVGDATEWTNRPWIIKGNKLLIPFRAKNYTTNKWGVSFGEFIKCEQ